MRDTRERVIRLEERDQRVAAVETSLATLDARVDMLRKDKDRREGADNQTDRIFVGVRGWTPVVIAMIAALASIFSAIYLAGRATGVVNAPPSHSNEKPIAH